MEPYLFDKPVWGKVDLYKQDQVYDGYTLDTNGLALGVGKSFDEYFSGNLKYGFDNSVVTRTTTTSLPTQLLRQMAIYGPTIATSAITAGLSWDSRDFYLDPKTGSRHSIFVEYAGGPLGGDTHFHQIRCRCSLVFPGLLGHGLHGPGQAGMGGFAR